MHSSQEISCIMQSTGQGINRSAGITAAAAIWGKKNKGKIEHSWITT